MSTHGGLGKRCRDQGLKTGKLVLGIRPPLLDFQRIFHARSHCTLAACSAEGLGLIDDKMTAMQEPEKRKFGGSRGARSCQAQ